MEDSVRPEIYGVMPVKQVESMLRGDEMPAPFIRRMRVINLLSALTLRKIEDDMIAPFEVMDIHHVLDEQISQDAIIAMLENKNLALALETGDMQPLWVESKDKPLLRKGFEQGWIQRFNTTPFDPICVMLATRAKLMLDVVDEEGHSYDLLRAMGMGWIDFGEIPGEEMGDPDSYVPPLINTPIDYPDLPPDPVPGDPDYVPGPGEPGYIEPYDPGPGEPGYVPGPGEPGYIPPRDLTPSDPGYATQPGSPGYIPPADLTPSDPYYTTQPGSPGYVPPWDLVPGDPYYETEPGSPGYIPPWDIVPGEPGYVPGPDSPGYIPPPDRVPGDPGYPTVPGESPDYPPGWDEAIHPGHPGYEPGPGEGGYSYPTSPGGGYYGGDYGPGGGGIFGWPSGGGGIYSSLAPPLTLGYGPGSLLSSGWGSKYTILDGINCCLDCEDPEAFVGIGYLTSSINAGETLGLTVEGAHEDCDGDNYEWIEVNGVGSLSAETGLDVIYTAPATGHNCPGNAEIWLSCGDEVVATLAVTINYDYAISFTYPEPETEVVRENSVVVNVSANGTPLTWSVAGTGFTLEHAETAGTGNVLHADETACGAATITITDCDGNVAVGFVRCTEGQWVFKSNTCGMSGIAGTVYSLAQYQYFKVRAIQGNKKQENKYNLRDLVTEKDAREGTYAEVCGGASPCDGWIAEHCASGDSQCLNYPTVDCVALYSAGYEFCSQDDRICHGGCGCHWNGSQYEWFMDFVRFWTPTGSNLKYYEWEC